MEIFFTNNASKNLESLQKIEQLRISNKMRWFAAQKDPISFAAPLSGYDAYRFRVGDYRIVFELSKDKKDIIILFIGKRTEVYKNL